MEKITKEELLEKLSGAQLSDDELEKVSGGMSEQECLAYCEDLKNQGKVKSVVICTMACTNG